MKKENDYFKPGKCPVAEANKKLTIPEPKNRMLAILRVVYYQNQTPIFEDVSVGYTKITYDFSTQTHYFDDETTGDRYVIKDQNLFSYKASPLVVTEGK